MHFRVFTTVLRCPPLAFLLWLCLVCPARASDVVADDFDPDDFRVSYIYAAIMGTGTYEIDGRRITMLRAPIKFTQRDASPEAWGITWYAPVSIGYDAVTDNNWLDLIFDEDLVTASVLPGFELDIPLNDTWSIRPLGNLGYTRDITRGENIFMGVAGLRALATVPTTGKWEFRWGLGFRLAGEYQLESNHTEGFSIAETGIDVRRNTGFSVLERKINAGAYLILQRFEPEWDISETPYRSSEVLTLVEVGLSVGLRRPRKLFGFSVDRVRVGYQRGDGYSGWTFGTKFPF